MADLNSNPSTLDADTTSAPPVTTPETQVNYSLSVIANARGTNEAARICGVLAKSKFVPEHLRGDIGGILACVDISQTLGCSAFMVMQNAYNVKGRIGFSGKYCIAALNNSPRYNRVEFRYLNGRDCADGMQVIGHRKDGFQDVGPAVTPSMVKGEGWDKNPKWHTMPDLMYRYRSASFFVNTNCPEILMGFQTVEEINDLYANGTYKPEPRNVTPRSKPAPAPQQETIPATIVDEEADLLDLD